MRTIVATASASFFGLLTVAAINGQMGWRGIAVTTGLLTVANAWVAFLEDC